MAIGFSPKYIQEYSIEKINPEYLFIYIINAFNNLGWKIDSAANYNLIAHSGNSSGSMGETVSVDISGFRFTITSESIHNQEEDYGKNKKNVIALNEMIDKLIEELPIDEVKIKYVEIMEKAVLESGGDLMMNMSANEKMGSFWRLFKPVENYFITPILININILVFIVMVISGVNFMMPDSESLLQWGANFRPETLNGAWWRLLSSCFLHGGILHLAMNMYALLYIGVLLEPLLGKKRYLTAYLATGVFGSLASLGWNQLTVSVGASGAIFGMYGVFIALLTTNLIDKSVRKAFATSILIFVGFNLVNGFKADSGIDNAAHIGGLISGIILGFALIPSIKRNDDKFNNITNSGIIALVLISILIVCPSLSNDFGIYQNKSNQIGRLETEALNSLNNMQDLPADKILDNIQNIGIKNFNEMAKFADDISSLDIPDKLKQRNKLIKEYIVLRTNYFNLLYKAVAANTNLYSEEMDQCNLKIKDVMKKLKE